MPNNLCYQVFVWYEQVSSKFMTAYLRPELSSLTSYHLEAIASNVIKLDANESPYDLPLEFKRQLGALVQQDIASNIYPDGIYGALKQAIADYTALSPEYISLGNGSDELIRSLLVISCLGRGGILIAEPTFAMYGILAETLGIRVYRVGRNPHWQIDLDKAQAVVERENVAAVFVVHPNSPTGNLLNASEIAWLKSLPQRILVVIDEAYYEFSRSSLISEIANFPNWVILRTFSKGFRLAAYRIGYAITSPAIISALEKVRLPYNLPTISARAAHLALEHSPELLAVIPEILKGRDELYQRLQDSGVQVWQSRANFVFCQTADPATMVQRMRSQGVLIRHTGGGLRITVGTAEQMARFWSAWQRAGG